MKYGFKKKTGFFLLFVFSALLLGAAPQSFFISPGTSIGNGRITRGYCLEYSKETLNAANVGLLPRISGGLTVLYKDGTQRREQFGDLLNSGRISMRTHNSYQFLTFTFNDQSIENITVGDSGIRLFREMTAEDKKAGTEEMIQSNIEKIIELERNGTAHSEVQQRIWTNRKPTETQKGNITTINFNTSAGNESVATSFNGSPSINVSNGIIIQFDGRLGDTDDKEKPKYYFLTHYHNDHVNADNIEQQIRDMPDNLALFFPLPVLDSSMKNKTYRLLEAAGENNKNFAKQSGIIEVSSSDKSLKMPVTTGEIGDFAYYMYLFPDEITVELFQYKHPKETNTDGLIYKFTHKNVSQLFFGDFDDPAALENLLASAEENQKKQYAILEERDKLQAELLKNENEINEKNARRRYIDAVIASLKTPEAESIIANIDKAGGLDELNEEIAEIEVKQKDTARSIAELEATRKNLLNQRADKDMLLSKLPTLKADVVKWPHHAHIFDEKHKEVLVKLSEVVDPLYFIYQAHSAQDAAKFSDFINGLPFNEKFLSSDKNIIKLISLIPVQTGNAIAAAQPAPSETDNLRISAFYK